MYRDEVLARVGGHAGRDILEVGCGEGMMFEGTAIAPGPDGRVDDARAAAARARPASCSAPTATSCRLRPRSFSTCCSIAVLEHTSEPWRLLAEARRVLKPGGAPLIVVPNDVTMSVGRLLLLKWPHPLSGSPDVHDAAPHAPLAGDGFAIREAFPLPFRALPFAVNLYYFVEAERARDACSKPGSWSSAPARPACRRRGGCRSSAIR